MIYLASTSPRRKTLLKQHGIIFKMVRPNYDESNDSNLSPARLVKKHAFEKGKSCVRFVKNGVILAADTIVFLKREVIGKPKNRKDAVRMLKKLQGRWHRVYTGVALIQVHLGKIKRKNVFFEFTQVKLKPMSIKDIRRYFRNINPLDKAGAYAIQSKKSNIIAEVKGSLTNAIGLPIGAVLKECRNLKK